MIAHLLKERVPVLSYYKLVLAGWFLRTSVWGKKKRASLPCRRRDERDLFRGIITLPYLTLTLPAAQTILWLQPSRNGKEEIADRKTAPKLLLVKPKWTLLPHIDMSDAYLHHTQRDSKSQPKWVPQKKKEERKKTRAALDRAQGKAS